MAKKLPSHSQTPNSSPLGFNVKNVCPLWRDKERRLSIDILKKKKSMSTVISSLIRLCSQWNSSKTNTNTCHCCCGLKWMLLWLWWVDMTRFPQIPHVAFTAANDLDLKVYCDPLCCQSKNCTPDMGSPLMIMFVRYSYREAGLVPGKIGLRFPTFPQVFYYPWAKGIMWLLGDALCSAHYYPNSVSMGSLTPHYDLLYTSTLQRPNLHCVSHSCCAQAPDVRGLKVNFQFKQMHCNWVDVTVPLLKQKEK